MRNRTMKRAFTLVEVLIVIVIIGILFIVLVSKVDFSVSEAKEMSVTTDFLAYQLAMEQVCVKEKQLPSDMNVLRDKLNKYLEYDLLVNVQDGHLTCSKEDPWGQLYEFEYSRSGGNLGKLLVRSSGGDKIVDTDDDIFVFVEYKNTPYGYKILKGDQNSSVTELPVTPGGGETPDPGPAPVEPGPTLPDKGLPLSSYTWDDIKAISEAGKGDEYFDVGDVFVIEGNMSAVIIGFNHDTISSTGANAGISFALTHAYQNATFAVNSESANGGGWRSSSMRAYLNDTVFPTLPEQLQLAIKSVNKLSDGGQNSTELITTSDKLWLFSVEELGFEPSQTLSGQGTMYTYFATEANRLVTNYNSSSGKSYWTRSARTDNATQYKVVGTAGTSIANLACTSTRSIIFGFSI